MFLTGKNMVGVAAFEAGGMNYGGFVKMLFCQQLFQIFSQGEGLQRSFIFLQEVFYAACLLQCIL